MIPEPEKRPGCQCLLVKHETAAGCREFGRVMADLFVRIERREGPWVYGRDDDD